jgi:hypothetical protein
MRFFYRTYPSLSPVFSLFTGGSPGKNHHFSLSPIVLLSSEKLIEGKFFRHRIIPSFTERMTTQQPCRGKNTTFYCAMFHHGFRSVCGTAGKKPAAWR